MRERRRAVGLWSVAMAATVALFAVNLWWGELNQDEGWYLYAAGLVREGRLPFLDFATTQGPAMAFGYVPATVLTRTWGLAGGRMYTAVLGLCAVAACAWTARRLVGRESARAAAAAGFLAFTFAGVNVYQTYFMTAVKTYALSGMLLALGLAALCVAREPEGKRRAAWAALAGGLLALAAAVRLSAAVAVPAALAVLVADGRRGGWLAVRSRIVGFAIAAAVVVAVAFLPFFAWAPEATWFGLVEYHAGREAGGFSTVLAYKAGFLVRFLQAYAGPFSVCAAVWAVAPRIGLAGVGGGTGAGAGRKAARAAFRGCGPIGWSVLAVSFVHLAAPFPYDDYQAMIFPLLATFLAVGLARGFVAEHRAAADDRGGARGAYATGAGPAGLREAALAVCLLACAASPLAQQWFVGERDRIWWPLKTRSPVAALREAGAWLRDRSEPGGELLTQDLYLAVEAGLKVPRGLEMGPFSFYPDWDRARAEACRVLNCELLAERLDGARARFAAVSGYTFAIRSPAIRPVPDAEREAWLQRLRARYTPVRDIERFGQAATRLTLLRLRDEGGKLDP